MIGKSPVWIALLFCLHNVQAGDVSHHEAVEKWWEPAASFLVPGRVAEAVDYSLGFLGDDSKHFRDKDNMARSLALNVLAWNGGISVTGVLNRLMFDGRNESGREHLFYACVVAAQSNHVDLACDVTRLIPAEKRNDWYRCAVWRCQFLRTEQRRDGSEHVVSGFEGLSPRNQDAFIRANLRLQHYFLAAAEFETDPRCAWTLYLMMFQPPLYFGKEGEPPICWLFIDEERLPLWRFPKQWEDQEALDEKKKRLEEQFASMRDSLRPRIMPEFNRISILEPGWQRRRNDLLWWRPDISLAVSNEVFHTGYRLGMDDNLRQTGERLLKELAKPDGGESAAVSNALDRLSRSGTFDVTNVLEKALTLGRNAYRFQTLRACVNAWPADMSGLAASAVASVPTETLVEWEGELADILGRENATVRDIERTRVFFGFVALAQPDPAHAIAYDRLKLQADPCWENSTLRKIFAARMRAAKRDRNGHFRHVSKMVGPPPPPDPDAIINVIDTNCKARLWDDPHLKGSPPKTWEAEVHQMFYETAPIRFGMGKRDLIRILAKRFAALPKVCARTPENEVLWEKYALALGYSASPAVVDTLKSAIRSAWLPDIAPERLDGALLRCSPEWGDSAQRQDFLEHANRIAGVHESQEQAEECCEEE